MAAARSSNSLEVAIPRSWRGKDLVVHAWTTSDEKAPTWNGVALAERNADRTVGWDSLESLTYRAARWDWPQFCLLREYVVPSSAAKEGENELVFPAPVDGRGEIVVGTLPTVVGFCGQTAGLRNRLSLDEADWRFKLVHDYSEGEELRTAKFRGVRSHITVPSNWEMAGFSKPTYGQWRDESPTIGMYNRSFRMEVPKGKRAHLAFEGASNNTTVWLNGRWIGEHESGYTAFDYDVTSAVAKGANDLTLRVSKYCRSSFFENAGQVGYWYLGGVFRPVWAYLTPETYVSGFRTDTAFSHGYKKASVTVTAEITGTASSLGAGAVKVAMVGQKGDRHEGACEVAELPSAGGGWIGKRLVQAKIEIPDVALWSAETPNLYKLRIELVAGGKKVDSVDDKVGLRELKIKGQVFAVNGVAVKLRGMCRHDFSPTDGYATKPELWKKDLELMRLAGVNAVRCSHYSPAEGFVRLCDELGFYVVQEAAGMWVRENADTWYPDYHVRAMETLKRDMNRACVLTWGLGNEHADTVNFRRAAQWCRRNDTRPVVYAGSETSLDGDLVTPHYVGHKLVESLDVEPKRPVLCTEDYTQSRGWWPSGSLSFTDDFKSYWDDVVLPEERINGMFIWEWDDRAVVYKDGIMLSNTVDYGLNSYESQVGPWRRTDLPWFNLLKDAYAPVRVDLEGSTLVVRNQNDFTPLGEASLSWKISKVDGNVRPRETIGAGSKSVGLAARSKTEVAIEIPSSRSDWIAVDVELKAGGKTNVKKRIFAAPTLGQGLDSVPAHAKADGTAALVWGAGTAEFDRRSCGLARISAGDRAFAIAGLVPNLWITPPGASQGGFPNRKDSLDWGNLACKRFEVEEVDGQPAVVAVTELNHAANPVDLHATYSATKNGLRIRYELSYKGREAKVGAVGVRFTLPGTFTSWKWRGLGPWATYPELEYAAVPGVYEAPIVAKRKVGPTIPMSQEQLIGQWEEAGGTKSKVDRFWVSGPDGTIEVKLGAPAFVELERVGNRVEVRINSTVGRVGDVLVPLVGVTGELEIRAAK